MVILGIFFRALIVIGLILFGFSVLALIGWISMCIAVGMMDADDEYNSFRK